MSSVIEEIKSRLNIVDVVGGYIKLEKAGVNFKARCPFHNEKTPSFIVSGSRQTYHCFGCNRGGDIISFVEEIEGIDFTGALKILADRAGIELKHERIVSKETKDEREALYGAMELATKFYQAVLPKFPDAVAYLTKRGLTEETIKKFRVGFAPDEWRPLSDLLAKKGVTEKASETAGLIVRSPKGFYDRFRGRIMFPIMDSSGRVVAFSGRILKEGEGKTLGPTANAKYVNSPETEIFHKSRALFGFSEAKTAIRQEDFAVLVEGQMDLILSHQAGVQNTVASSGTALTSPHIALIKRFTKNLVLAFDADSAGLAAARRAVGLALSEDMTVRIAKLKRGIDPADLVLESPEAWRSAVKGSKPVIDFYLELLPELYANKDELRQKVSEIVVPFIAEQKSVIDQGHYVGQVAKLLHIKEEPVWEEVKKKSALVKIEYEKEKIEPTIAPVSRRIRILRTIEGLLLWQKESKNPLIKDIEGYRARITKILGELPKELKTKRDELIFEAEVRFQGNDFLESEIETLLKNLEEETLRDRFAEKMEELKEAEAKGDTPLAQKLLIECQVISKELHTFKSP